MYKMSAMFWYRIFFMTELLVAESALVYRFKTRSYFLLRMAAALVMCFAFAFAVPIFLAEAVVNTHNCYEGKLSFDKMLPKTTKADTNMHGYGMKSIKHVVEKYGGEMSVKAENGVFNLNLIFPCGKLRTDSTENEIGIAKHGNMD